MCHATYDILKHQSIRLYCPSSLCVLNFRVIKLFSKAGASNSQATVRSGHADSHCSTITGHGCSVGKLARRNVENKTVFLDWANILTKRREADCSCRAGSKSLQIAQSKTSQRGPNISFYLEIQLNEVHEKCSKFRHFCTRFQLQCDKTRFCFKNTR